MEHLAVALHIFFIVLALGTLWRLGTLHCLASSNPHVQHVGKAMSLQY